MFLVPALDVVYAILAVLIGLQTPMPPNHAGIENSCFSRSEIVPSKMAGQKYWYKVFQIGVNASSQLARILCRYDHSNCMDLDSAEKAA